MKKHLNRKSCYLFGILYIILLGYYISSLLYAIFIIYTQWFSVLWISTLSFTFSIRYVFSLEIRKAVISGIIISSLCITYFTWYTYLIGVGFNPGNLDMSIPFNIYMSYALFNGLIPIFLIVAINLIMLIVSLKTSESDTSQIKRILLNYGIKIDRLKIVEISEKSKVDTKTVLKVIQNMIKNEEIYCRYFESSKVVAFNQIRNIEEIDNLLKIYEEWEHKNIKKI